MKPESTDQSADEPASQRQRAEAISELFREHNRALVHFLLTRLPNEAEAREVAQEAYVRLLQLDKPIAASFLRWTLFKIAHGIAVDRHRQRTVRVRLDRLDAVDELDVSSPTENSVMASDELAQVLATLRELPRNCQQAFLLHRFRDLSTVEVAQQMGLTDRMVRKYVQRALVYCRLRLDGWSKEDAMRQVMS
ncbi:RNA polymerase sigma factor [Steroidobacter sp.]|uniref:RNA polymerase sigma factor n=1 Tax=Steroidobacter sp. TaxID=1978227 RepID=UPI001A3C6218|nr:sigma-70 family RNA polymerase sigma factor [Steroidobacter sp.]MBL8269827.1 sigma-70 family RNA polymerase sigma factor [Steroidobacter sp.]